MRQRRAVGPVRSTSLNLPFANGRLWPTCDGQLTELPALNRAIGGVRWFTPHPGWRVREGRCPVPIARSGLTADSAVPRREVRGRRPKQPAWNWRRRSAGPSSEGAPDHCGSALAHTRCWPPGAAATGAPAPTAGGSTCSSSAIKLPSAGLADGPEQLRCFRISSKASVFLPCP